MSRRRTKTIRKEDVRKAFAVRPIAEKIQGNRLRWFGHVERRGDAYVGKIAADVHLEGKRSRCKPKTTWASKLRDDLKQVGADKEVAQNSKL